MTSRPDRTLPRADIAPRPPVSGKSILLIEDDATLNRLLKAN